MTDSIKVSKPDFFADPQVFNGAGQKKFTDKDFRDVVVATRTAYLAKGGKGLPSVDEINAVCRTPVARVAKIISTEAFAREMRKQGIEWKPVKGLTARQHYALMLVTDPSNRKPLETRLKHAGITMGEYRNWVKQPLFASLVNNFAEQALPDHMAQAHMSLLNQVDKGDMRAVEFYYAMTGRYNPQSQVERDINSVLVQVVDIIQRAGLEQDKLELIASGIKSLMSGSTGPAAIEQSYRSERSDLIEDEETEEADYQYVPPDGNWHEIPNDDSNMTSEKWIQSIAPVFGLSEEVINTPAAVAEQLPVKREFRIGD